MTKVLVVAQIPASLSENRFYGRLWVNPVVMVEFRSTFCLMKLEPQLTPPSEGVSASWESPVRADNSGVGRLAESYREAPHGAVRREVKYV